MKRRSFFAGLGALLGAVAIPARAQIRFQPPQDITPLILEITKGIAPGKGGVEVELPVLVENGNTVAMTVTVESPMRTADHVKVVHVFNEKNPQPNVIDAYFGPRAARASFASRIRLADTQTLVMAYWRACQRAGGVPREVARLCGGQRTRFNDRGVDFLLHCATWLTGQTTGRSAFASQRVRTRTVPPGPHAWTAFINTLSNTWLILPGWQATGGKSP